MVNTLIWLYHTIGLFWNSCTENCSHELDDKPLLKWWFYSMGFLEELTCRFLKKTEVVIFSYQKRRLDHTCLLRGGDFTEIRWWFQSVVYFYPYLGKWSNLTSIFFNWLESTNYVGNVVMCFLFFCDNSFWVTWKNTIPSRAPKIIATSLETKHPRVFFSRRSGEFWLNQLGNWIFMKHWNLE